MISTYVYTSVLSLSHGVALENRSNSFVSIFAPFSLQKADVVVFVVASVVLKAISFVLNGRYTRITLAFITISIRN